MNDTDVTGPLPVIPAEEPSHGPVGWITEANRRAEEHARNAAAESVQVEPSVELEPSLETGLPVAAAPAGEAAAVEPAAVEPAAAAEPTGPDPDLAFDFSTDPPVYGTPAGHEAGPEDTASIPVVPALEVPEDSPAEVPPPRSPAPPPKSRHGQPAPLSRAWNAGVAATIAVAAVVVGIVAFNHASSSSKPSANGPGPAFVLPTAATGEQGGVITASSPPGLDALPTTSASAKASAAPTSSTGVPADAPSITVLNETSTHGLAATEAARLRAAGWTVRRVTNINARLTQTTVYYDASQEAAAKALVASVPSVKAALPRPSYVLSTGGLIVVVASDAA